MEAQCLEAHLRGSCNFFLISRIAVCFQNIFLQVFFPFLFIGSAAKTFETLKKKCSRKRINFQKSSRSGAGTRDIETAKKELEEFSSLRWLDSFIRPRKTKTNIPEPSVEINESSNAGDELENNGYGSDESEDAGFDAMTDDTESFTTLEESAPSKKCKKEQATIKQKSASLKKVNQAEIMGAELDVVRDMSKVLNKSLTSMNDEKQNDEDDLFEKLVAA